jgi:hypothetical protein
MFSCELDGQGGKDQLDIVLMLQVPRTKERGTKLSIRERPFRDRLSNSRFPSPGQSIQPVDGCPAEIPGPELDLV